MSFERAGGSDGAGGARDVGGRRVFSVRNVAQRVKKNNNRNSFPVAGVPWREARARLTHARGGRRAARATAPGRIPVRELVQQPPSAKSGGGQRGRSELNRS